MPPNALRAPLAADGGHRKRILHRRLRTLAYHRIAWLQVTYAEYQSRCACCSYFRTWPLDVPQKADYDATVRQAVLDRLLHDREGLRDFSPVQSIQARRTPGTVARDPVAVVLKDDFRPVAYPSGHVDDVLAVG